MNSARGKKTGFLGIIGSGLTLIFAIIGWIVAIVLAYTWIFERDLSFFEEEIGLVFGIKIVGGTILGLILLIKFCELISKFKTGRIGYKGVSGKIKDMSSSLNNEFNDMLRETKRKMNFQIRILNIVTFGLIIFYIATFRMLCVGDLSDGLRIGLFCFLVVFALVNIVNIYMKKDKIKKDYARIYKYKIVPNILKTVEPNANVKGSVSIGNDYKISGIEDAANFVYANSAVEDAITAINDRMIFGKINVTFRVPRPNDSSKDTTQILPYGFVTFTTSKAFAEHVKIKMNKEKPKDIEMKQIEINNTEFNKHFKVYAISDDVAKGIVNVKLVQILLDFYKKCNVKFDIVFRYGKIYMKLYAGNAFEPETSGRVVGEKKILQYYNYINSVKELCLALDANI